VLSVLGMFEDCWSTLLVYVCSELCVSDGALVEESVTTEISDF
jgi:hypothetical protein